jgi:hypothetical protein
MRKSVIAGAVLLGALALAGQAAAAGGSYELNLWGASAQFQLYNQSMPTFLQSSPYSCTSVVHSDNGTLGITTGTGCYGNGSTITVRASSKASYDGVLALQGLGKSEDITAYPMNATGSNFCDPNEAVGSGVTPDYHYRVMYNTTAGDLACKRVDLALSDVNPTSFTQSTSTTALSITKYGSGNGRSFTGTGAITASSLTGFNSYNPIIVPFGFYASTDVKYSTCSSGTNLGQQCTAGSGATSSDCPVGYNACTSGTCAAGVNSGDACKSTADCPTSYGACTAAPLNNLSKLAAILIFTQQATHWQDLGLGYSASSTNDSTYNPPYPANFITTCYRVAGSGTLATLDYGVLKATANGTPLSGALPTTNVGLPNSNYVYFNDGTGAELACINGNTGAIGFADADQALYMVPLAPGNGNAVKYPNIMPLNFEGIVPSRRAIRNGEYDNFFSKEWVFQDPTSPTFTGTNGATLLAMVYNGSTGLIDQLSTPGAISATDRRNFWAAFGEVNGTIVDQEMVYMKSVDKVYPGYEGAFDQQYP